MLVNSWLKESCQPWNQEYQLSGCEGGWGASQQETPRIGEALLWELWLSVGAVSLATWKIAFLIPQRQRAARESWFLCALNCMRCSPVVVTGHVVDHVTGRRNVSRATRQCVCRRRDVHTVDASNTHLKYGSSANAC